MTDTEKFVLAANAENDESAKAHLQKAMKQKVAEKLVKVLSQEKDS